jgi:transcription initiation factor TFIIH subunit 3
MVFFTPYLFYLILFLVPCSQLSCFLTTLYSMSTQNGSGIKFSHLSTAFSEQDSAYVKTAPDFLALIFDLDPYAWASKNSKGGGLEALQRATQDVCVFLNAHTALRHDNSCAVYAAGRSKG